MTQGLPKVFLAIGMKGMEEFLKKQLAKEFQFVGEAIYREAVVNNALQSNPDIIILRETLNGSRNILDIVYDIRLQLPDTRIIFLASDRKPGDVLLAELVGNGVYDIMTGNRLSAPDLMNLMREPNKFSDVAMYRPKMTINKNTQETLFEAPPVKEVVKQVKQTVFVEGEMPILPPSYGQQSVKPVESSKSEEKREKKIKRNRRRFLKGKEEEEPSISPDPPIPHEEPLITFDEPPKFDFEPEVEVKPLPRKERTPKLHAIEKNISAPVLPKLSPKVESPSPEDLPLIQLDLSDEHPTEEPKLGEKPLFVVTEPELPSEHKLMKSPPVEPKQEIVPTPVMVSSPPAVSATQKTAFLPMTNKQKILTFVGGEHGVGNSQVAHNTALALGSRGYKTIFIELKEEGSTIEYLYQLALADKGLDYALRNLAEENFAGLEDSIIRVDEVKKQNTNSLMDASYRTFPANVDYLFFSPDYILEQDSEKKHIEPSLLKELCMHMFFQLGYQYVVLDAEPNLFNPFSEVALGFGTHVFFTVSQDVCHIGRAVRNISEINKRINITSKLYYIVNKFDGQAALSKKDIEDWLKSDVETTIPMMHKEFINANMNGVPILLSTKDKILKKSFEEIVNHILQK